MKHKLKHPQIKDQPSFKIDECWSKISPSWPLKNVIAVNPLIGFQDLPFKDALTQGQIYFQQSDLPGPMQHVNRESIKWLQSYFDEGQAAIKLPGRQDGFLSCLRPLMSVDSHLENRHLLKTLPVDSSDIIQFCLDALIISESEADQFLTLMLTTLPGWATHISYRIDWANPDIDGTLPITKEDYLAFRLILAYLMWPQAKDLLHWHNQACEDSNTSPIYETIKQQEELYQSTLINSLQGVSIHKQPKPVKAQFIFCIDVRSEVYRRHLESTGSYDTYGFAGFFGLPVSVENSVSGEHYASCPILLKPLHKISEIPCGDLGLCQENHKNSLDIKRLYQSTKYTFTSPFALVETVGWMSGIWMGIKTLFPDKAGRIKENINTKINPKGRVQINLDDISLDQQVSYAESALKTMGLTSDFAPLIFVCGHGSESLNNAFATSLDCGACGGRHGASNAKALVAILNNPSARLKLQSKGIAIPQETHFMAALHNTTTDELCLFEDNIPSHHHDNLNLIKQDLTQTQRHTCQERHLKLAGTTKSNSNILLRSKDWSQVRPEWGLAGNSSFIVAPRWITESLDLEGRSFLHSYDWSQDGNSDSLTAILTAPVIVGYWINSQYLFSTLDPVAFGAGSKVTKNITGKIGVIQGNGSDLMHGLPVQSVYLTRDNPHHTPVRLSVVIYAPQDKISQIITQHELLKKLVGNEWIHILALTPDDHQIYGLSPDFKWNKKQKD